MIIVGQIEPLKVGVGFIRIGVRDGVTNELELLKIYDAVFPEHLDLSAFDWIDFSMKVSLAREALARGLEVRVVTIEGPAVDTGIISQFELRAPNS